VNILVSPRQYVWAVIGLAIVLLPFFTVFEAARRIGDCDASQYSDDNFLNYCWGRLYGGYEKGAYFLPTEPAALAAVKAASLLIIGDSRAGYAFSNDALDQFSKETGLAHYNLAFAGEGNRFIERLIDRHGLKPKMVIINLDGIEFFDQPRGTMQDASELMTRELPSWVQYRVKQLGQKIQRRFCHPAGPSFLCSKGDTVYRKVSNGHWLFQHRPHVAERYDIIAEPSLPPQWATRREAILEEARLFVEHMKRLGTCVVFTNIPGEDTSPSVAKAQADAVGVPFVLPELSGLRTFDHSHLAPVSGQRFAAEFVRLLRPYIAQCSSR